MSQFRLFRNTRFVPLFWTQFFGAFNDNLFKNALAILITYRAMQIGSLSSESLVALASGLFILPFFLFSAMAGQLSDKYSKTRLMRWVKLIEILLMSTAATGFLLESLPLLLATLFLMGLQSTFFGPAKYSVLPEILAPAELTGGNALVETGTFLAILLGTVAGGLLVSVGHWGIVATAGGVIIVAIAGWLTSLKLPRLVGADPDLAFSLNPLRPLAETLRAARKNRAVFLSILGISWFWFFGASFLTLLPIYTKHVLYADERVVTLLLALFCVGIAIGSLLCERFGGKKLELGLVPLGSLGMSLAALDLALFGMPLRPFKDQMFAVSHFLVMPGSYRIMFDFILLAVCGGIYTVPLYTLIQQRAPEKSRSRVIAANNILNACFMVVSALLLIGASWLKLSMTQLFAALAILNGLVAIYIYSVVREFLLRFIAWLTAHVMYRIKIEGDVNIPAEGPALLTPNHVSYVDWLLITTLTQRPIRFVMYHGFLKLPLLRYLFRDAKAIPIAPARENQQLMDQAFDQIAEALAAGELVCVFPEGRLTADGNQGIFRRGIERVVARNPVPVIPVAIKGMWGSFFSRKDGKALRRPFRRLWSRVTLRVGKPMQPDQLTANSLAQTVAELGGWRCSNNATS